MLGIINGKIYTMAGQIIENGQLLIEDGKIKDLGKEIDLPEGIKIIDAKGRMVTPGIVDPHSHIGIGEEGIGWEGIDYNERTDPSTPHMRAIDGIYPSDLGLVQAKQGGITSVVTGPGSANAIGGTFVAMKTHGHRVDDMVIKDPAAMKVAFGENIKRVYGREAGKAPTTRMSIAAIIREELFKAREYMEAKDKGDRPKFDMKLEALIPVLKREIPIKAHAHRSDDIFTAIRIAKEFDLWMTLDHCSEGHLIAEDLAKEGYGYICGPNLSNASKYELKNRSFITPAALQAQGVKVAIMTDNPVIPSAQLPICAGLAHRSGLEEMEALKAITINAAEITGIDDRVGSLEIGKDGDIVIWSKNPIKDVDCQADYTIIDGQVVYENGVDEKLGF